LEEEIKVIKERKPNIAKHIAMEVSSKISIDLNMIGIKNYDEKYKERYQIPAFDLNLSVTKSENGYVAIRHKNAFNSKYHYSKGNTHPFQEEIKSILQQYGYKQSHIWLGVKYFKEYGSSTNEIIDAIIKEIKDLLNKLNILSQAINKESLSSS
ncbi:hypothetical protein LJC21_04550, partial [Bacteroides sp. OttesenSCG-928-E20]|nr:hypothetical protein [Bacteroides sp. OttesenSCG-928-E20]